MATASFSNIAAFSTFTISDALFMLSGLAVAWRMLMTGGTASGNLPSPWPSLFFAAALIAFWGAIATVLGSHPTESAINLAKLLAATIGLPLLALAVIRSDKALQTAIVCVAVGGAAHGLASLFNYLGLSFPFAGQGTYGRFSGLADHPNHLGTAAAIALQFSIATQVRVISRRMMFLAASAMTMLCLIGLLFSGSVGAAIAAACGLLAMAGARTRRWLHTPSRGHTSIGWLVLLPIAALLILQGVTFLYTQGSQLLFSPQERMATVFGTGGTASSRIVSLNSAIDQIAAHPIKGNGFSDQDLLVGQVQAHNMLILAWQAGGIFVVLGILIVLAAAFKTSWNTASNPLSPHGITLLGATTTLFLSGLGQPLLYKTFIWVPVALLFTRPSLQANRRWFAGVPKRSLVKTQATGRRR